MQSMLRYEQSSDEECGVWTVDVRTIDILEDMMSLHFLVTNSRKTYIPYMTVDKKMVKHRGVFPILGKQKKKLFLLGPPVSGPVVI